jgi:hypothetical protein
MRHAPAPERSGRMTPSFDRLNDLRQNVPHRLAFRLSTPFPTDEHDIEVA